jgi:hypothetical protein
MCLVLHGFPSAVAALRFEWQLQHPEKARSLRGRRRPLNGAEKGKGQRPAATAAVHRDGDGLDTAVSPSGLLKVPATRAAQLGLSFKLKALAHLLRAAPWRRMALTLHWLEPQARARFEAYGLPPPAHILATSGSLDGPAFSALTRLLFRHEQAAHAVEDVALEIMDTAGDEEEDEEDEEDDDNDEEGVEDGEDAGQMMEDGNGAGNDRSRRAAHEGVNDAKDEDAGPFAAAAAAVATAASCAKAVTGDMWRDAICALCQRIGADTAAAGGAPLECWAAACDFVAHASCLALHLLAGDDNGSGQAVWSDGLAAAPRLLPVAGSCPACGAALRWGDLVRRQTLRAHGVRVCFTSLQVSLQSMKFNTHIHTARSPYCTSNPPASQSPVLIPTTRITPKSSPRSQTPRQAETFLRRCCPS